MVCRCDEIRRGAKGGSCPGKVARKYVTVQIGPYHVILLACPFGQTLRRRWLKSVALWSTIPPGNRVNASIVMSNYSPERSQ